MTLATRTHPAAAPAVRAGLLDVLPILLGLAPFGVTIGAAVAGSAMDNLAGWLGGPLLAAGAAHLAIITTIDAGGGALVAVITAVVINARLAAYSAAMAPLFIGQPRWFRWAAPYALVDQAFAVATARSQATEPRWFRRYWVALTVPLCLTWYALITAGMALGPVIPASWEMWFVSPLMFVAMGAPSVRDRRSVRSALVAVVVAAATTDLPGGVGLVLAIAAGCLAGAAGRDSDE